MERLKNGYYNIKQRRAKWRVVFEPNSPELLRRPPDYFWLRRSADIRVQDYSSMLNTAYIERNREDG